MEKSGLFANSDKEKFLLTDKIREMEVIDFQLRNIKKTLDYKKDVTKDELVELYGCLKELFKPEALQTLENIESFHKSLQANRRKFLLKEQEQLVEKKRKIEMEIDHIQQKCSCTSL